MIDNDSTAQLNYIFSIVEKHGCRVVDVDFDTYQINLDGPEENKAACALALAKALED
jgi:c-di-GMP-binding flagellar brake protein YcgR